MKKRRFTSYIAAFLAVLMFLLLAVSCENGKQQEGETTPGEHNSGEPSDLTETLRLVAYGESDYKIIYPEGCSDYLFSAVRQLISAFETYTGAKLPHEGDFLPRNTQPGEYEILIGNTNRTESGEVKAKLGLGGYAVQAVGTKLVLCGCNDDGTVSAVDHFVRAQLSGNRELSFGKKDGSLTITAEQNYLYSKNYPIQSISVNGTEAKECKLVIPKNGASERLTAEMLQDHLFTFYGYQPEIVTDDLPATGAEIRIGKTSRTTVTPENGMYTVQVTENALEAVSSTVMGLGNIAGMLLNTVLPYSEPVIALTAGQKWEGEESLEVLPSERGQVRVMYHNILGYTPESYPVGSRSDMTLQVYREYMPDVLGLQEASGAWRTASGALLEWLSDAGYQEVCFSAEGGTGNPIFYRSDLLELRESGYKRKRVSDKGVTWCVFEVKDTGELFAVTNAHFSANSNAPDNDPVLGDQYRTEDAQTLLSVVNEIEAKYAGIPVISGGDFNSRETTEAFAALAAGGLKSARTCAEFVSQHSARNGYPTYDKNKRDYSMGLFHSSTVSDAIDHIVLNNAASRLPVLRYVVLKDRISCTLSDHLPHYIDFDLS